MASGVAILHNPYSNSNCQYRRYAAVDPTTLGPQCFATHSDVKLDLPDNPRADVPRSTFSNKRTTPLHTKHSTWAKRKDKNKDLTLRPVSAGGLVIENSLNTTGTSAAGGGTLTGRFSVTRPSSAPPRRPPSAVLQSATLQPAMFASDLPTQYSSPVRLSQPEPLGYNNRFDGIGIGSSMSHFDSHGLPLADFGASFGGPVYEPPVKPFNPRVVNGFYDTSYWTGLAGVSPELRNVAATDGEGRNNLAHGHHHARHTFADAYNASRDSESRDKLRAMEAKLARLRTEIAELECTVDQPHNAAKRFSSSFPYSSDTGLIPDTFEGRLSLLKQEHPQNIQALQHLMQQQQLLLKQQYDYYYS